MDICATHGPPLATRGPAGERHAGNHFDRLTCMGPEILQRSGVSHHYENLIKNRQFPHNDGFRIAPVYPQMPNVTKLSEDDTCKDLLKSGDLIKGRWQVLQKVGGGGFGEIYEAIDIALDVELRCLRETLNRICPYCFHKTSRMSSVVSQKLDIGTYFKAVNNASGHLQVCKLCGLEFTAPVIPKHSQQRPPSVDAGESVDSGNSSSYSDKISGFQNRTVAIKVESNKQPKQMLRMEVAVLRRLTNKANFCEILACGKNMRINYVVMTLQGKNLSELRKHIPSRKFGLSTALRITYKCLVAIEVLHNIGFLHRDIKPSNFCLRRNDPTEVCLLDFGLVRQYTLAGSTTQLRPERPTAGFRGTVRYASINAHNYKELGRHDDLWSMYYMLAEFLCGQLPWHRKNEKELVKKLKMESDSVKLGTDGGLPLSVALFWVDHLQHLNYSTRPLYNDLKMRLENWLLANGICWSDPYDWQLDSLPPSGSPPKSQAMFRRKQPTVRQYLPNNKRPVHHDSSGCLRLLDRRSVGSSTDFRIDCGTTVYGGQSTAAVCDDALTSRNKTMAPGCVTMATENLLEEAGVINADETSEKVDGKAKVIGSHMDLTTIGESVKCLHEPTNPIDKQFLQTGQILARSPHSEGASPLLMPPPIEGDHSVPASTPLQNCAITHDSDLEFLPPENGPQLPSNESWPRLVSSLMTEGQQSHATRLPMAYRRKKTASDGLNDPGTSIPPPKPKPRSRYTESSTFIPEERELDVVHDEKNIWFCRDDIPSGFVPVVLAGRNRIQRISRHTLKSANDLKVRSSSAGERHILAANLGNKEQIQPHQANFESSSNPDVNPSIYRSQIMLPTGQCNEEADLWFPIIDGRVRSGSTDLGLMSKTYNTRCTPRQGFSRRPALEIDGNWRPDRLQ